MVLKVNSLPNYPLLFLTGRIGILLLFDLLITLPANSSYVTTLMEFLRLNLDFLKTDRWHDSTYFLFCLDFRNNFSLGQHVVWKKCHWIRESPFRITLQKKAHFAFSMQNCIHYFRWTVVLIVVTNSFLTDTKNDKYGSSIVIRSPVHQIDICTTPPPPVIHWKSQINPTWSVVFTSRMKPNATCPIYL